jgi:hypothetical protein
MAAKMQGGDYDGDDVVVIWDPEIVGGFKAAPPLVYSEPGPDNPHVKRDPIGALTFREILSKFPNNVYVHSHPAEVHAKVNEHVLDWFCYNVKKGKGAIGKISKAHTAWSDLAMQPCIQQPDGLECAECRTCEARVNVLLLADLASHALDEANTGCVVTVPPHLLEIEEPNYCFGDKAEPEYIVHVRPIPDSATERCLSKCFAGQWPSVHRVQIRTDKFQKRYAFVYFAEECERNSARDDIKQVILYGETMKISRYTPSEKSHNWMKTQKLRQTAETRAEAPLSTSPINDLWAVHEKFRTTTLAGLGADQPDATLSGEDPVLEAELLTDHEARADAATQFKKVPCTLADVSTR